MAYLGGRSIAAPAREHGVSRGAIRTAVADLMPEHTTAGHEDTPPPELPVTLDMPGKIADFLRTSELDPAERAALDHGVTVRRGQGYTLRVTAAPSSTAGSSPTASPSTAPQPSPHSARPAASTRTASAPSRRLQPDHDQSQRQPRFD
ncbi:hypothetical protein [Streptomyces brasiliensis]|uniref:Resolvase n=1 Tax=Streptomyces brasiliensis TaxID=1954 RepID=A0A917P180_9ACTN|nr:hypothetical protein [Streptomyces brasiliensis]GGJ50686.1 hypothetical protein GCM10010121_072020 [Streptomyces brasiliensis]